MDTLQMMRAFSSVVRGGSFTEAAQQLQMSTVNVSRMIASLEAHLQVKLLNRTTRRIALTEIGRRYLDRCEHILTHVADAESEVRGVGLYARNEFNLHIATGIDQSWVIDAIARHLNKHPDTRVKLSVAASVPDFGKPEYDLSIQFCKRPSNSHFHTRPLGQTFDVLCVSAAYASRQGTPTSKDDLTHHHFIHLDSTTEKRCSDFSRTSGVLGNDLPFHVVTTVNTQEALANAVISGLGIGLLPIHLADRGIAAGDMIRVLPDFQANASTICAVSPSDKPFDSAVSRWCDLLQSSWLAPMSYHPARSAYA